MVYVQAEGRPPNGPQTPVYAPQDHAPPLTGHLKHDKNPKATIGRLVASQKSGSFVVSIIGYPWRRFPYECVPVPEHDSTLSDFFDEARFGPVRVSSPSLQTPRLTLVFSFKVLLPIGDITTLMRFIQSTGLEDLKASVNFSCDL